MRAFAEPPQVDEVAELLAAAPLRAADDYVHESPWQAVGIGVGVGFLLGIILGRR